VQKQQFSCRLVQRLSLASQVYVNVMQHLEKHVVHVRVRMNITLLEGLVDGRQEHSYFGLKHIIIETP